MLKWGLYLMVWGIWINHLFALAPGWTIEQITNFDGDETIGMYDIDGSHIFWVADYNIYVYDGLITKKITDYEGDYINISPTMSGQYIAWIDKSIQYINPESGGYYGPLCCYNGSEIIRVTGEGVLVAEYDISGSNLIFAARDLEDEDQTDYELYLYNGSTITQLTNNILNDRKPLIHGQRYAWVQYENHRLSNLLYNDGSSTIKFPGNAGVTHHLITDTNVFWSYGDIEGYYLFSYDGMTVSNLGPYGDWHSADAYADKIVLSKYTDCYNLYYFYDGMTVKKLGRGIYPTYNGKVILYNYNIQNYQSHSIDCYDKSYDYSVEFYPIIVSACLSPKISGDKAVWLASVDVDAPWQLYLATQICQDRSPADLNSDCVVNMDDFIMIADVWPERYDMTTLVALAEDWLHSDPISN